MKRKCFQCNGEGCVIEYVQNEDEMILGIFEPSAIIDCPGCLGKGFTLIEDKRVHNKKKMETFNG